MPNNRPIGICVALMLGLALGSCAGCKSAGVPVEESRLSRLATYYGRFIASNKGMTPGSETELKQFIKKLDAEVNVDELFVSPRDSQPYVVLYNQKSAMPGVKAVTAHERSGVDGKRLVAFSTGEVQTLDEAEFKKLLPPK